MFSPIRNALVQVRAINATSAGRQTHDRQGASADEPVDSVDRHVQFSRHVSQADEPTCRFSRRDCGHVGIIADEPVNKLPVDEFPGGAPGNQDAPRFNGLARDVRVARPAVFVGHPKDGFPVFVADRLTILVVFENEHR